MASALDEDRMPTNVAIMSEAELAFVAALVSTAPISRRH